ncbi:ABC transporter permease [Tumebacillus lipolyticus]|uniref:ABC transporter permease n=1 Tax=Tumebacillus lipolyticus TaxID=1280370 RepID=A0ABW4ZZG8_9BACL
MRGDTLKYQHIFAWTLVLLLLLLAVFGSHFMPYTIDEGDKVTMVRQQVDGEVKIAIPPFPPSKEHLLGTDHRGFDLLSLLLNGAKYTLGIGLAVTLARFLIAIPIGMYIGVTGIFRSPLRIMQVVSSSVPVILILFPALYSLSQTMAINSGLQPGDPRITFFSIAMFIMLVIAGIFTLADQIADRAQFFYRKEYVAAAKSLGASSGQIIVRHLLPQFRPELLYGFVTEYVQVLFLVGQLAVLGVFVGGSEVYFTEEMKFILLSSNGEWASMIAYGTDYLRNFQWIVVAPGLFFASSVLILSYFAHVLQKRLDRPVFIKRKPFWQQRGSLIAVPAVSIACVAILLFLPDKQPVALQVDATADQEHETRLLAQSTLDARVTGSNEKSFKLMLQNSTQFMKYLEAGKWEYARSYFEKAEAAPPEPWRTWIEALTAGGYKFVGAEKIYKNPISQKVASDAIPRYDVEVIVKNRSGQEERWLLVMKSSIYIVEAVGGPAQSVPDR